MKAGSVQKQRITAPQNLDYKRFLILVAWQMTVLLFGAVAAILWQRDLIFFALFILFAISLFSAYFITNKFQHPDNALMYEALFNQNNDAVFILDLQGNNIAVNQVAADMLGYTIEELNALSVREIIAPTETSHSKTILERLNAGEHIPIYERLFRTKTGEVIPVELNVQMVKNAEGKPLHVQSIARDIRQRRASENALQKSENQLRSILSALPDRAVILDSGGYYRDVLNTIATNPPISGLNLRGEHVSSVSTPEFTEFCLGMIAKTLKDDAIQSFEYSYQHDNKVFHFDGRTAVYNDIETGEKLVIWITRDITERKKAAQSLMNSEQRLRTFASALPDRAIVLDAEGYYHDVLKERYDDITILQLNVKGKRLHDLFGQEFIDFCLSKIHETLEKNQALAFDYEIKIQGVTYYLDGRTIPTTDPETGEPRVFWISRDISRLKHVEMALQYQNRLHSLITALAIEFVNLPLDKLDASIKNVLQQVGEFIEAERSYINLFSDDFLLRTIAYEWYAEGISPLPQIQTTKDISSHQWSFSRFKKGEVLFIHSVDKLPEEARVERESLQSRGVKSVLSIPLIKQGKLIGTLGFHAIHAEKSWPESLSGLMKIVGEIYVNALQRKEAEEALIDSEKRLRILIRSMPDRAVIFDREGHYHEILKDEYESMNMSPSVYEIRQGQRIQDIYSPEFSEFCLRKIAEALDANTVQVFEYTSPIRGDAFKLEARIIPFRDPQTKVERVFWVTRDISERLQAEQHRLELTLAKEKVDFLRQFVDSITHDLKTPITVIGTSLHLVERTQDANKRQERMAIIRKQLGTLTHMVDELLAVARLDEIPQLQFTSIEFYKILQDVVDFLAPKAELKQIKLSVNLTDDTPKLHAAYDELSRALSNLIDNAIKYTPNNGSVSIKAYSEQNQLIFEVQDTGIGMSPEEMLHVFERFFRTDRARSEAPGTGLGLEITRRIIELHGGRIDLESEVNRGTTFRVWLPLIIDEGLAEVKR